MSNPTNPFSWQMPTATDLVTDLPADFEVFGQAVATSLADLLGGTTGQVLSKTTNADMDFTWVAANPGDITAVTAGTGISGGGTSGAVTITNDMATTITASGDIVVGTGSGTYDNLPIGTTGQVLTADTTVSPYKVKWASASAGGFVGCRIKKAGGANQNISHATTTTITFDAEDFDTDGFHDNSTNNTRITIPAGKGGKYLFTATGHWQDNATGSRQMYFRKNGSDIVAFNIWSSDGAVGFSLPQVFELVATDYIELVVYQDSSSTIVVEGAYLFLSATYLGA